MRAAVYHGRGDIRIEDVPDPVAAPGEVLLEVATVGICGTDVYEFTHGPSRYPVEDPHPVTGHAGPFIPGHEFSGYVAALGDGVDGLEPGALVACGAGISCGVCEPCLSGSTNRCDRYVTVGLERNGALAELVAVPASICLEVGSVGLGPDTAALAQPMAIGVHAARRGRPVEGERALVLGAGGIGTFLILAAVQHGVDVIAVDPDPSRRSVATALGASVAIDPSDVATGELVFDAGTPDIVYEASGTNAGLVMALTCCRPGARLVVVGMQKEPVEIDLRRLALDEVEIIGTNAHRFDDEFTVALDLLASRSGGWGDVAPDVLSLEGLVPEGIVAIAEGRSSRIKTLFSPMAEKTRRFE